jgi:hypothetical protein
MTKPSKFIVSCLSNTKRFAPARKLYLNSIGSWCRSKADACAFETEDSARAAGKRCSNSSFNIETV